VGKTNNLVKVINQILNKSKHDYEYQTV